MRETVTVNRIIHCRFFGKEVAQQISAYAIIQSGIPGISELLTKYCSGEHSCKCPDCQFIIGLGGTAYSKPLDGILRCFDAMNGE